ncbi:MAG: hypothetical protein ACYSSI_13355, partial [Planctomycetota bacterium]
MKLKEIDPSFSGIKVREGDFFLYGQALSELVKSTVRKGAFFRFRVKGFSMSPFIKNGDVVTISPLSNSSTIGLGRIAAFAYPMTRRLIVHRIVGRRFNNYIIKADTSPKIDGLVSRENILGIVVKV